MHQPTTVAPEMSTAPAICRRVLVVDDNRDAADSLALLLEMYGHVTSVAYEGQEAVHLARSFAPHIAFVDLALPGLDGCEVARRIRGLESRSGMMLVALTGYGRDSDRERSREAGFDDHLVKPVNPQELLTLIGRVAA